MYKLINFKQIFDSFDKLLVTFSLNFWQNL